MRRVTNETPTRREWTIVGETGSAGAGGGDVPRLSLADLEAVVGWAPKPQGWCRGAECIPASFLGPDLAADRPGGTDVVDASAVAAALGAPIAVDDEHHIAVIGHRHDASSTIASGVGPDVELVDVDGRRRTLFEDGHAKTLVVAFSSWCGCRYDLPGWKALRDELADHDFGVVAVAIDESTADVEPWAADVDLPVLVDTDRRFADAYDLVNVPTVVWLDDEHRVVRQPSTEFSDDQFTSVHGVESGPHLDAVRRWVRDDLLPTTDDAPPEPTALGADQQRARAEFRLALELHRRGHTAAAAAHVVVADRLAPDDFTIWRAGMQLVGDDPFGAEFFDRYLDWQRRTGNGPGGD